MSDRAISLLRQLPNLRMIDVSASKVTGKGFEHPDEYPRLEHICLKENDLTEEGFEVLARLKNLKELDLRLAKFNEQWFKHFRNHPKFVKLKVVGDVDVGRIRRMIPHLQITTD